MSYLVLARKWRPQSFGEVVGQDHVTRTLSMAVEKGRLAHAYLFAGPRGCGKTTTARLLAKVINCEQRTTGEPCNECFSCRAVIDGRHLDMIEIDGASNRGIDEIRDLREKIGYAPSQGKAKIYIIDEVHMLTPQAFNALLKTLEEPPSHVYMIFATTEPHKVPLTILSRCQRFNFKRLELGEMSVQLEKICEAEKVKYDREALRLLSRRAEGSMRDAESLLDQCISAATDTIDLHLVRSVLGLVDTHVITDLVGFIARRDTGGALEVVDRAVSAGLDLEEFFLGYIESLRNLMVLSIEGGERTDWMPLSGAEIEDLKTAGEPFRTEDLLYLFRAAAYSLREIKASSQPRYQLEAAVAEAASWESAVELSELLQKLDGSEGGSGGTPGGRAPPRARTKERGKRRDGEGTKSAERMPSGGSARVAAEILTDSGQMPIAGAFAKIEGEPGSADPLAKLGGRGQWERFLSQVREAKVTLGIWLMSAEVRGVRDDRLVLAFRPEHRFAREMIREEKNKRYVESHLERFFGRTYIVETEEAGETRKQPVNEAAEPAPRSSPMDQELVDLAKGAPVLESLIRAFEGELYRE